jgi:hypothetical protein
MKVYAVIGIHSSNITIQELLGLVLKSTGFDWKLFYTNITT